MSVMNGFRTELIDKIIGFNSHITVKPYENKIKINEINKDLERISKDLILSNSGEAVIVKTDNTKGILLRGYKSKEFSKLKIFKNKEFVGENENLENNNISLGKELSFTLNLDIGDSVTLLSSVGIDTIIGSFPKQKTFIVSSIFGSCG